MNKPPQWLEMALYAPPPSWEKVIDGHKITPKMIQRTLKKCRKNGADLNYLADRLGVGVGAIKEYIDNERSIPATCAEKFYQLVTENKPVPLAPPDPKPAMWKVEDLQPMPEHRPNKFRAPDIDGKRIGEALAAERQKRGWSLGDAARKIHGRTNNILRAENGQVEWITNGQSILVRLSKLYGLDLREFETRPRIDYALFQTKITVAKAALQKRWEEVAHDAQISRHLMAAYASRSRSHAEVMYLAPEMMRVMTALGIDPNSVILKEDKA